MLSDLVFEFIFTVRVAGVRARVFMLVFYLVLLLSELSFAITAVIMLRQHASKISCRVVMCVCAIDMQCVYVTPRSVDFQSSSSEKVFTVSRFLVFS